MTYRTVFITLGQLSVPHIRAGHQSSVGGGDAPLRADLSPLETDLDCPLTGLAISEKRPLSPRGQCLSTFSVVACRIPREGGLRSSLQGTMSPWIIL